MGTILTDDTNLSATMTQPTAEQTSCGVCGDPLQADAQADCYSCGQLFHLALTSNSEVDDCGQVWIDDEVMALQFACNRCLAEPAGAADQPEPPQRDETPRAQRAEPGRSAREIARRRRGR